MRFTTGKLVVMKTDKYVFLLLLMPFFIFAQKAVLPSGGAATGNGSISYSVGEITYLTLSGADGSVSAGIQQPFEISVVLETPESEMVKLLAYPNPATDFVILTSDRTSAKMTYELFDATGKKLSNGNFDGSETKIDMSRLASAAYFLTILNERRILKTFRILKK